MIQNQQNRDSVQTSRHSGFAQSLSSLLQEQKAVVEYIGFSQYRCKLTKIAPLDLLNHDTNNTVESRNSTLQ